MIRDMLREMFVLSTRHSLPVQDSDGNVRDWLWSWGLPSVWAMCWRDAWEGNPFHRDPKVLDAILRFGDFNARSVSEKGTFTNASEGDWRYATWLHTMLAVRDQLDDRRAAAWRDAFIRGGQHLMRGCIDMDTFDGQIPNHGIWWHMVVHHIGQVFEVDEFTDMTTHALSRVIHGQTPDGCFREGQSDALMPGSPVTHYNIVSADALDKYFAHTGNPAAAQAIERAWRWFHDFLLPDYSTPPCFDSRQNYTPSIAFVCGNLPALWVNKPEGRFMTQLAWQQILNEMRAADRGTGTTERIRRSFLGFHALRYDLYRDDVEATEPVFDEYNRMTAGEACVRRREPWVVAMCGLTNVDRSTTGLRLFQQERQDLVSVHHRDLGLVIGSGHSQVQEEFSSFVFYESGRAHYLHEDAYLKSTPALDTLQLRYGANIGAVSADTSDPEVLILIYSIHGERGRRSQPGAGHPLSAMAARAHFSLRLQFGDKLTLGERTWTLDNHAEIPPGGRAESIFRLRVEGGQTLRIEGTRTGQPRRWSITAPDGRWELRWPIEAMEPYAMWHAHGERVAIIEALLHGHIWGHGAPADGTGEKRPTATFEIRVG